MVKQIDQELLAAPTKSDYVATQIPFVETAMTRPTKTVTESHLAAIVESGAIHTAYILEDNSGRFHIVLSAGNHDYRLEKARGGLRHFKTLDAAAQLIRSWGISKLRVHMHEYKPGTEPSLVD